MLTLNTLKSPRGAHKNTKRLGRGQASGQGTQAGKGHKGQKARTGGGVRTGFEGGNMPLYKRVPKRGFSNCPFKTIYAEVSLGAINTFFNSEEVSRESLIEKGLLRGANRRRPIKVLANGEFAKALTFINIDKFSKSAEELIKKVNGKIKQS